MPSRDAGNGNPSPRALDYEGHRIRHLGAMLSLTDMWSAAGRPGQRRPADWLALDDTRRFRTQALERFAEAHLAHHPGAGDASVWIVERDGLVATRRGPRGGTWAHWQLALSYGRYLSPAFHAWCNTVLRAAMARTDESLPAGPDAVYRAIAAEFRRLHRRLDVLDRHAADQMFLQTSAQEILLGSRRHFSAGTRGLLAAVLRDPPYGGLCPCCGETPVLDAAGLPVPGAEFDHAFHRGLNKPEHGWLVCQPCHREFTRGGYLVRFARIDRFRAFQAAVSARRRPPGTVVAEAGA